MSEDNSWVFDSLICFLHGPVWNAPLQTFIEEKSLIFDPNQESELDNPEYQIIHDEYKCLVDSMLGSFMEEMHITAEQFERACLESKANQSEGSVRFQKGLFQQIWAANDLNVFVRIMTQRNVELQLQALDLLERQKSQSVEEENEPERLRETTNDDVELESKLSETVATELSLPKDDGKTDDVGDTRFERLNLFFDNKKIDSAEIQARQEYLRTQRDRIVEIKKKARARQLNETTVKNTTGTRPSSAQVAKQILEGHADEIVHNSERNEASIQLRKALARRLRSEVVGDN